MLRIESALTARWRNQRRAPFAHARNHAGETMKVISSAAMKRRRLSRTLPTVMATLVVLCVAVYTVIVTGPAAHAAAALLSQGKQTTASSAENATFAAGAATDGNTGTRWSSAFSDPQWIQVDLGSSVSVCQVTLNWEAAFATGGSTTAEDRDPRRWLQGTLTVDWSSSFSRFTFRP